MYIIGKIEKRKYIQLVTFYDSQPISHDVVDTFMWGSPIYPLSVSLAVYSLSLLHKIRYISLTRECLFLSRGLRWVRVIRDDYFVFPFIGQSFTLAKYTWMSVVLGSWEGIIGLNTFRKSLASTEINIVKVYKRKFILLGSFFLIPRGLAHFSEMIGNWNSLLNIYLNIPSL